MAIWLTMMMLVIGVENLKLCFLNFLKNYDIIYRLNRALGNASGNLMMVKISSWMT